MVANKTGAQSFDGVGALFGESASRAIVSVRAADRPALMELAASAGVPANLIGKTGGSRLVLRIGGRTAIDLPVETAERAWATAISRYFKRSAA
jgi:phosphoribosylformylglycinamidine synthase